MRILTTLSLAASATLLVGCVSGKYNYTPPADYKQDSNTKIINKGFDTAWKESVASLGKHFFVINNLDKSSGLINISYSGSPEKYIDCGIHYNEVADLRGKRSYTVIGAAPHAEYDTKDGYYVTSIIRKMELEGRMNLLIQPISSNQTRATVNTKYVVTRTGNFRSTDGRFGSSNDSISFNTGGSEKFPTGGTICSAKGTLEKEILDLLN